MNISFKGLLKGQPTNNLVDMMNEVLQAIEDQKKYYDSPMVLSHFEDRLAAIKTELAIREDKVKEVKSGVYTVRMTGERTFSIENNSWYYNTGIFYYTPEETKGHHKNNLFYAYGHKQLIGCHSKITNKKLYTKIINAWIKGELK